MQALNSPKLTGVILAVFCWLAWESQHQKASNAEMGAFVAAKLAEYDAHNPRQVKLYKPRGERERQAVIAELWNINDKNIWKELP